MIKALASLWENGRAAPSRRSPEYQVPSTTLSSTVALGGRSEHSADPSDIVQDEAGPTPIPATSYNLLRCLPSRRACACAPLCCGAAMIYRSGCSLCRFPGCGRDACCAEGGSIGGNVHAACASPGAHRLRALVPHCMASARQRAGAGAARRRSSPPLEAFSLPFAFHQVTFPACRSCRIGAGFWSSTLPSARAASACLRTSGRTHRTLRAPRLRRALASSCWRFARTVAGRLALSTENIAPALSLVRIQIGWSCAHRIRPGIVDFSCFCLVLPGSARRKKPFLFWNLSFSLQGGRRWICQRRVAGSVPHPAFMSAVFPLAGASSCWRW